MKLSLLLFDLGHVVFHLDFEKTLVIWSGYSGKSFQDLMKVRNLLNEPNIEFEKGLMSSDDFRKKVNYLYGMQISENQFEEGWNAMITEPLPGIQENLPVLKLQYRMAALSNANILHEDYVERSYPKIMSCFEHVYYSHHLGLRKPDRAIYQRVLDDYRLSPDDVLFFDDRPENIDAAEFMGLNCVLIREPLDVRKKLEELLMSK